MRRVALGAAAVSLLCQITALRVGLLMEAELAMVNSLGRLVVIRQTLKTRDDRFVHDEDKTIVLLKESFI